MFDHSYKIDPPSSFSANYTAPASLSDCTWYPDFATKRHITNDLSNLTISSEQYQGGDTIRVGDGAGLPIQHHGQSSLSSGSTSFTLKNLLHVPSITKNLVSVL